MVGNAVSLSEVIEPRVGAVSRPKTAIIVDGSAAILPTSRANDVKRWGDAQISKFTKPRATAANPKNTYRSSAT